MKEICKSLLLVFGLLFAVPSGYAMQSNSLESMYRELSQIIRHPASEYIDHAKINCAYGLIDQLTEMGEGAATVHYLPLLQEELTYLQHAQAAQDAAGRAQWPSPRVAKTIPSAVARQVYGARRGMPKPAGCFVGPAAWCVAGAPVGAKVGNGERSGVVGAVAHAANLRWCAADAASQGDGHKNHIHVEFDHDFNLICPQGLSAEERQYVHQVVACVMEALAGSEAPPVHPGIGDHWTGLPRMTTEAETALDGFFVQMKREAEQSAISVGFTCRTPSPSPGHRAPRENYTNIERLELRTERHLLPLRCLMYIRRKYPSWELPEQQVASARSTLALAVRECEHRLDYYNQYKTDRPEEFNSFERKLSDLKILERFLNREYPDPCHSDQKASAFLDATHLQTHLYAEYNDIERTIARLRSKRLEAESALHRDHLHLFQCEDIGWNVFAAFHNWLTGDTEMDLRGMVADNEDRLLAIEQEMRQALTRKADCIARYKREYIRSLHQQAAVALHNEYKRLDSCIRQGADDLFLFQLRDAIADHLKARGFGPEQAEQLRDIEEQLETTMLQRELVPREKAWLDALQKTRTSNGAIRAETFNLSPETRTMLHRIGIDPEKFQMVLGNDFQLKIAAESAKQIDRLVRLSRSTIGNDMLDDMVHTCMHTAVAAIDLGLEGYYQKSLSFTKIARNLTNIAEKLIEAIIRGGIAGVQDAAYGVLYALKNPVQTIKSLSVAAKIIANETVKLANYSINDCAGLMCDMLGYHEQAEEFKQHVRLQDEEYAPYRELAYCMAHEFMQLPLEQKFEKASYLGTRLFVDGLIFKGVGRGLARGARAVAKLPTVQKACESLGRLGRQTLFKTQLFIAAETADLTPIGNQLVGQGLKDFVAEVRHVTGGAVSEVDAIRFAMALENPIAAGMVEAFEQNAINLARQMIDVGEVARALGCHPQKSSILQSLKSWLNRGKKIGNRIETMIDENTKIQFRKDFGKHGLPPKRGYPVGVNIDHYNIDIFVKDTPAIAGWGKPKAKFHIVVDTFGQVTDFF